MSEHLKRACSDLGKQCRISMDLAGPKLRFGPIEPGPEVINIRPQRDLLGRVVSPARLFLIPERQERVLLHLGAVAIPIASGMLSSLRAGDRIHFIDTRSSSRRMVVKGRAGNSVELECNRTAYLASRMELRRAGQSSGILRVGRRSTCTIAKILSDIKTGERT